MSPAAVALPNVRGGVQEVLFAQRLADNEKKIRDRALKTLRKYIAVKSSIGPGFSDDDAIKIWKGLFYCMYMADKPLVQEELAEEISELIHDLGNLEDCYTFTNAAFQTFAREWNGIDIYRIDKFMMFMRRVLRQVFVHLKLQDWNLKEVGRYVRILDNCIIRADDDTNSTPLGIKLHLCSILLEELAKIGGAELDHAVIIDIIKPYFKVLALSKIKRYRMDVCDDIINYLMAQTEIGVEYESIAHNVVHGIEEETLKEDEDAADEEEEEEGETSVEIPIEEAVLDPRAGNVNIFIPQLKPDFNKLADALQSVGSIKKICKMNRNLIYSLVKKCRDMAEDVYPLVLPEIAFERLDYSDEKQQEKEAVKNLKDFYSNLANVTSADLKELEDFKKDPLKNFSITRIGGTRKSRKSAKKRMKRLNGKKKKILSLTTKNKLAKQSSAAKVNRMNIVQDRLNQLNNSGAGKDPSESGKKKKNRNKAKKSAGFEVSTITPSSAEDKSKISSGVNNFEVSAISSKVMIGSKRKVQQDSEKTSKKVKSSEGKVSSSSNAVAPVKKKSKKKKMLTKVSSGSSVEGNSQSSDKGKKITSEAIKEKPVESSKNVPSKDTKSSSEFVVPEFSCQPEIPSQQKVDSDKSTKSKFKALSQETQKAKVNKKSEVNANVKVQKNLHKASVASPGTGVKTPVLETQTKDKDLVMNFSEKKKSESVWKKPLKNKEIEIFIKDTRQMKLEKKRNASLNSPKGTPKNRERTIKINLKENKEHEFKDYVHSVRNSPQIPFSADRLPRAPVLKPSPSPILVGRSALKILKNVIRKSGSNFASPVLKKKSPRAKKFRSKAADFF